MATKKPAAAGAALPSPLTKTFVLAVPVMGLRGEAVTELTLVEPELQHEVKVARRKTATEAEATVALLSELSGLPEDVLCKIKLRDARKIGQWVLETKSSGVQADALGEAADRLPGGLEGVRTFRLLSPVPTDGAPLVEITVREPDIETGIAVEKMDTQPEQTAAMIASCSGVVVPLVMRMKIRDVRRIERWLDFFLQDGGATPPEAEDVPHAARDGATSPSFSPAN